MTKRKKVCRKTVYTSKAAALDDAMKQWKRGVFNVRAYWCKRCDGFHLTSKMRSGETYKLVSSLRRKRDAGRDGEGAK